MADRTKYYHEWYLKNKDNHISKSLLRRAKLKKKLGKKKFQEWEKEQNDKKRKSVGGF